MTITTTMIMMIMELVENEGEMMKMINRIDYYLIVITLPCFLRAHSLLILLLSCNNIRSEDLYL